MSMDVIIADAEAEKACLTTMFLKKGALLQASERMLPSDFYHEHHRLFFKALASFARDGMDPDMITLKTKLVERGLYEKAGGDQALLEIACGYSAFDVTGIIDAIITLSKRRKLKAVTEELFRKSDQYTENLDELLAEADEKLRAIRMDRSTGIVSMRELCDVTVDDLPVQGANLTTQFRDLDYLDAFRAYYVILAARTSKGKTALALNIASYVAMNAPVLFFSLEMGVTQLRNRILCSIAGVDERRVRTREMGIEEMHRLNDALARSREMQLEIVTNKRNVFDICSIARRRHQEKQLAMIVIDYIQKVKSSSRNLQRYQQIGEISGEFQGLVQELNVPMLCCAQLSRSADNKEPELVDLRESGDLEQDADVVMFLHAKDDFGLAHTIETDLMIKKHRNGPLGTVELLFEKPYTRFRSR